MRKLLVVAAAALACAVLSAQAGRPTFEVASVKRNTSGPGPSGLFFQPGGRLQVTNRTLRTIISAAYGTPQPLAEYQLIGGPKWLDTDRFDITAKAAGDPQPGPSGPPPSMFLMLQSLLEERFHLKMHRETQELPIFVLTLARGDGRLGPQMHASATDCAALRTSLLARGGGPPPMPLPGERPQCGARQYPGNISAGSMTIAQMVSGLSRTPGIGRPIVDRTGLTGAFDFDLTYTPDRMPDRVPDGNGPPGAPPIDPNGPSLFTALQEQLGLKLEPAKGPVDVIVIEGADPPTED